MVSPIEAKAEPKERLRLVCKSSFLAALMEAIPSGNKITAAMITPTKDCGNPAFLMIVSIGVESFLPLILLFRDRPIR